MDAGWIEALTDLWREDAPIDFAALEKEWRLLPLETGGAEAASFDEEEPPRRKRLMVCLTGFLNREWSVQKNPFRLSCVVDLTYGFFFFLSSRGTDSSPRENHI